MESRVQTSWAFLMRLAHKYRNILHDGQIPLIEYNQPGDAAHQARNDQHPGVPPCQPMEDKRINCWRIVIWSPLECPGEFLGEPPECIDQVSQHDDAHGSAASGTTCIDK